MAASFPSKKSASSNSSRFLNEIRQHKFWFILCLLLGLLFLYIYYSSESYGISPVTDQSHFPKPVFVPASDESLNTSKPDSSSFHVTTISEQNLPRDVIPDSYNLTMRVFLPGYEAAIPKDKEFTFEGLLHINLLFVQKTDTIELNSKGLEILELSTNNKDTEVEKFKLVSNYEKLFIYLSREKEQNSSMTLTIRYRGNIGQDNTGFYRTTHIANDGKTKFAAVTKFEPVYARRMVPCFDQPNIKAKWLITVEHPRGTTAISNELEGVALPIKEPADFMVTHFAQTPKMSSYLLAILVSDYKQINKKTRSGLLVRVWSRPEVIDMARYALDVCADLMDHFAEKYAIEYPLSKQDLVALPDFASGAMENWGLVTFRENLLLYDEKLYTPGQKAYVANVISHELVHQWFGNLVTLDFFDSVWLNEGFATYQANLGVDAVSGGYFELKRDAIIVEQSAALSADSVPASHPMTFEVETLQEIGENFDTISYDKGASILFMIENVMGSERFYAGLQSYLRNHQYGNVKVADLLKDLSAFVDKSQIGPNNKPLDLFSFALPYIMQMGFPLVSVEYINSTHAKLSQKRFNKNPSGQEKEKFRYPEYGYQWDVPLNVQDGNDKTATKMWLARDSDAIVKYSSKPLILNVDSYGFYLMNYKVNDWEAIFEKLQQNHQAFSAATRVAIIRSAFAMFDTGRLPVESLFKLFPYMAEEKNDLPWYEFLSKFDELLNNMGFGEGRNLGLKYLNKILKPRFDEIDLEYIKSKYTDDREHVKVNFQIKIYLTFCKRKFMLCPELLKLHETQGIAQCKNGDIASSCVKIAAPLRATAYCEFVKSTKSFNDLQKLLALRKREPIQIETQSLTIALTCANRVKDLRYLLERANDRSSGMFRDQDVPSFYAYVASTEQGQTFMLDFLIENWHHIYKTFVVKHRDLSKIIRYCGKAINTQADLDKLKKFVDSTPIAQQYSVFNIIKVDAEVRLAWKEKYLKKITDLLSKNM